MFLFLTRGSSSPFALSNFDWEEDVKMTLAPVTKAIYRQHMIK
jgi:hypothetical protein